MISLQTLLTDDHEAVDVRFETYLESRKAGGPEAAAAFQRYASDLIRHMEAEEQILFPALERTPLERPAREVPYLLDEHETMRALIRDIEGALERGEDTAALERRLFEELHDHNAREEMHVYPAVDGQLTPEEARAVVHRLRP